MIDEKNITTQFTEYDKLILSTLNSILDGLADYLGDAFEFVLHSLENLDASVIKIINGHHTGRSIGAPITNLALTMMEKIENNDTQDFITYFSKNRSGAPLKATTIAIRGEHHRIIGLLCINCYLNTPLISIIQSLVEPGQLSDKHFEDEYLTDNIKGTIEKALDIARTKVDSDPSISASMKNKQIILLLYSQGIFEIKDAVNLVASELNISPNTVYLHLRNAKNTAR